MNQITMKEMKKIELDVKGEKSMNNILHILIGGNIGGIEKLIYNYSLESQENNYYCFVNFEGVFFEKMDKNKIISLKKYSSFFKKKERIFEFVKQNDINIVITHHASPYCWALAYEIKKKFNACFILYCHGVLIDKRKIDLKKKIVFNLIKNKVDKFVAISDFVADTICLSGVKRERIIRIYNGVKLVNSSRNITERKEILYIGRLKEEKGVSILIEALNILKRNGRAFHCTIVGEGDNKIQLKKLVDKYNLGNDIFFAGSDENVNKYYEESSIFVHPAIWEEGFGISIVEAMSAGLICIVSNCGALPEIISNRIDGLLFEKGNYNQLAQLLYEVSISDEKIVEEMRKQAINTSKKFNMTNYVKDFDAFINTIKRG